MDDLDEVARDFPVSSGGKHIDEEENIIRQVSFWIANSILKIKP